MRISRIVIRNFRNFDFLDVSTDNNITCIIGENNTGKSNFLYAIRLCIDVNLPSIYRSLLDKDIHYGIDLSYPNHVLIGLEITDYADKINEEALAGAWMFKAGHARLIYRYRPKKNIMEELESGEKKPGELKREDYQWEIVGGGDQEYDLKDISWEDNIGSAIRFSDLQSFLVIFLNALRDVESDLRQLRISPLAQLIDAMDIDSEEKNKLLNALRTANKEISDTNTFSSIANAIDKSFNNVSGPAFGMHISLGLTEPSFQAIIRAMRLLLDNSGMKSFDSSSNGLGSNNILYVSILLEYFNRRLVQKKTAGQIILFEEPEAHLHPQLQLSLFKALKDLPFQCILTTHSTHITARAGLSSYVVLTPSDSGATTYSVPVCSEKFTNDDVLDLERYLDATRSNLLFARKVILVEGPAELFLIPVLLRQIKEIDLEREGISIIPIYGIHFDVYAKLFSPCSLQKKCAIIADGDMPPSSTSSSEDDYPTRVDLKILEGEYVKVFTCETTFERALTDLESLEMLACAADSLGAVQIARNLRNNYIKLSNVNIDTNTKLNILNESRESVLRTAKRFGKARFAQIACRYVDRSKFVPKYIMDAVTWLMS